MNKRPTPETDAFMTRIRGIDGDKHWVPADTAKRLERERDEARKLLANALVRGDLALEETKKAQEDLLWSDIQDKREMQRERDEARAVAARIADILSGLELRTTEELARLEQERNEAREALRELWQTADAYIPQIDEEQATKWHHAMFGNSKNG
jgi:polyhydroxyalkanoate synthesis regulator phasin